MVSSYLNEKFLSSDIIWVLFPWIGLIQAGNILLRNAVPSLFLTSQRPAGQDDREKYVPRILKKRKLEVGDLKIAPEPDVVEVEVEEPDRLEPAPESIVDNEGMDQSNGTSFEEFDVGVEVARADAPTTFPESGAGGGVIEANSGDLHDTFRVSDLNFSSLNNELEDCNHDDDPVDAETPDENFAEDSTDNHISGLEYFDALSELRNMESFLDDDATEHLREFELIKQKTQKALDQVFSQKRVTLRQLIETDDDLVAFAGIRFNLLEALVEVLDRCEGPNKRKEFALSTEDRVLLCLTKLKINLSFKCLRALFGVTRQTCANTFIYVLCFLEEALSSEAIYWPTDEEHIKSLPQCFQPFRNVRVVLDCTEVSVEKPKCLSCRLKLYSFYKGCETVKFLIGVSPSGMINFVSDAYGGRASDKSIFTQSNLFDYLIPTRDEVMVDKGFDIDTECAINHIKLVMPPFRTQGRQFHAKEVDSTKKIASARVHIERRIQRLKISAILKQKISWKLVPYIDKIAKVIAILSNLQNPILSDKRF